MKASKFDWTLDDIRLEKISKFLECHGPHKVKKKMLENWLGPNLGYKFFLEVSALQNVRYCPKLQSCTISMKTNEPNLRKWQKKLISGLILTRLAKMYAPKIFL